MITSFADLCTYAYVVIDDLYQAMIAPHDHRPGPRSGCSESEIITLTVVAELTGQDDEGPFLAYLRRNHPTLFPLLPERSRYNRRRRRLIEVTNRLRLALLRRLLRRLDPRERTLCLIDSLPVPVVGFAHARGRHRWYGEAASGHNAATALTFYGFKLHLLTTQSGLVLDFALVPANRADGDLSAQLLSDNARLIVLGDKASLNAPLQQLLAWRNGLTLLTPRRANQPDDPCPHPLTAVLSSLRQAIETLTAQLAGQFQIERNRAKSLFGLCARVQAKLTAHTLGVYLNHLCGQPTRALAALNLI
jgi:hypothetical protein